MKYTKNNIIINFLKGQGLGNQLWVLFSGIQISKILNCNIRFGNGKFFKGFFLIKVFWVLVLPGGEKKL